MSKSMSVMQKIKLLGVPFGFGQPQEGVKRSPLYLRQMGLISKLEMFAPTIDLGDVDFSLCENQKSTGFFRKEREALLGCELISHCIESESLRSSFLLNVGGDHGLSLGTIHGLLSKYRNMVVFWADAHGDINTPGSSPSGNFHGMPLAFLLGLSHHPMLYKWFKHTLSPNKLIYFGPRDLDLEEKRIIQDLGIQYYSSSEINFSGAEMIIKKALKLADPLGDCPIHLSFDIDLCDGMDIQATGTRVMNGPNLQEVWRMGEVLAQSGRLVSADLVELNPDLGSVEEVKRTFEFALSFLEMLVGITFNQRGQSACPLSGYYRPDDSVGSPVVPGSSSVRGS